MPYSWLATAFGLNPFLVNLPVALATLGTVRFASTRRPARSRRPAASSASRSPTAASTSGTSPSCPPPTGGGLGFQTGFGVPGISAHETGHTLTVASFGGVFHWIGAVDENIPPLARGAAAYNEVLAESHLPQALPRRHVLQWS